MPELTESERVFFERARPEFERLLGEGVDAREALKTAARGVIKQDEALFLILGGVGRGGRDAAEALKSALSEHVYKRLRAKA